MSLLSSDKILIAIQFWEHDRKQALALARLMADIQPGMCAEADFLFVNRFDCPPVDVATIKHVSRKFRVHNYRSPRRGTGWPNGCNELWFGTIEWFYHMAGAKKIPGYKAILTFEADCAPLHKDWVKILSKGWDRLQEKSKIYMAGKIVTGDGIHEHVNGNCLVSGRPEFLKWLVRDVGSAPANVGWDYCMSEQFKQWGWANLPGMECRWGTRTMTGDQLQAEVNRGVVFLHGVKDYSAQVFSRKILT